MKLQKKQLSNTRLLFKETIGFPQNWYSISKELKRYVEASPKLNLQSDKITIYFMDLPIDIEIEDIDSLVAIEVTGSEDLVDEELRLMDLDKGECYSLDSSIDLSVYEWDGFLNMLEEMVLQADKDKEVENMASTWAVLLFFDHVSKSMRVDIQFFNEL